MEKFSKKLEDKARHLANNLNSRQWDTSILSTLRREIGLTIDHINRQKLLHEQQLHRLLRIECYIGTDLMQLKQHIPWYTSYHFPEKEKLKKQLIEIEKERRNLTLRLEDKKHSLESHLLSLINKHDQLDFRE